MVSPQTFLQEKILVIKLGAFGDFIQALGAMKAIRAHHKNAHVTLMTTKPFLEFGQRCGYFNEVILDTKPKLFDISCWMSLRKNIINAKYKRIYDLQNNDRTSFYFKLFPRSKKPEWVGVAKGASHENASPERTAGHAFDGHVQTLALAGVHNVELDTLDWIKEDLGKFNLIPPFALIVSGSAQQHPQKRWPAEFYGALANELIKDGIQPVLIGAKAEKQVTDIIENLCPQAINLTGKTSLFEIAALAHQAKCAIGNDTGPMHLIAATGCPSLSLLSGYSKPHRHAPKGKKVKILQSENIKDITTSYACENLKKLYASTA